MLHPHASMTHASVLLLEDATRGSIMEIDGEIIVKPEDDAPQSIPLATLLDDEIVSTLQHGAVALRHGDVPARSPLTDEIMLAAEIAGTQPIGNAFLDDALGDDPLRIHVHAIDIARQQRRLRLQRS